MDGSSAIKPWLKRRLGERWRRRAHRLSRVRWVTKARIIRAEGLPVSRHLAFILLDPEVESYTYRIANIDGMLDAIADATGIPPQTLAGYVREADSDPALTTELGRRLRWRLDVKRRPQLANRLCWYVLVRAVRPELVVETGIYHGLGSLVLLRALARNAADGAPGTLVSFDADPEAGDLVPRARRAEWERVVARTDEAIADTLRGRRVGVLFQDTEHSEANQTIEFGAALANAADPLLLVDGSGGVSPTLAALARDRGASYWQVPLGAANHWYQHQGLAFARFSTQDATDGPSAARSEH